MIAHEKQAPEILYVQSHTGRDSVFHSMSKPVAFLL